MKLFIRPICTFIALVTSAFLLVGNAAEPLRNITTEQREALTKRVGTYVELSRGRKWDKLYDLVSDVGRGGVNRQTFIAAMNSEHGTDFAQMPDLLEFKVEQVQNNGDGYDIYGCGEARREGMMFHGVAVMHTVLEHGDWFFTGWRFTTFPNKSCNTLSDTVWKPEKGVEWNSPMEEVQHFKSRGVPFHVDSPH